MAEILQAVADLRDSTDHLIVLGIGGSALGTPPCNQP